MEFTARKPAEINGRVEGLFGNIAANWQRYRIYRETCNELNSLSDRELSDIGLHRSMVKGIAREHAYGA